MNKQIITTSSGERLVVISEEEYVAMREALDDIADGEAVRAFRQKLAAGTEDLIPAEYADRILNGEGKVRVWREYRGLTAVDLASRVGISPAYLSQIETGARESSLDVMRRIARALGVSIDDLV
ncbi:MAG: helix-turn-helix domain-containing protein [Mesorhizobium sp.]